MIQRMDHVGIVVDNLAAATAFFVDLGLEKVGEGSVEGGWVDGVAGLQARGADLVGTLERFEDSFRLCYVRGPEGIIVELAEPIG